MRLHGSWNLTLYMQFTMHTHLPLYTSQITTDIKSEIKDVKREIKSEIRSETMDATRDIKREIMDVKRDMKSLESKLDCLLEKENRSARHH